MPSSPLVGFAARICARQPPPKPGGGDILPSLLATLRRLRALGWVAEAVAFRAEEGRRKYGFPLQASNGRAAIADGGQELLDFLNYTEQMRLEGYPDIDLLQGRALELLALLENIATRHDATTR